MFKTIAIVTLLLTTLLANAQVQPIPKVEESQKINQNLKPNGDFDMFNNLNHPLAITGGLFVLGGAATYVVGSELDHSKYSPNNTTQFVGIGVFAVGAVLFTVFSTERDVNKPKRQKVKKKYNASDWEAQ
jgi:uncharacterized membrane protein